MLCPYWLTEINNCKIGISPCPSYELEVELERFVLNDSFVIVSSLTEDEIEKLKLENEKLISERLGINYIDFPIRDMSIPGYFRFIEFIDELYSLTKNANRILIHCRAGIGRSSLIAIGLMTKHKNNLKENIIQASKIRGYSVPQSVSQKKLLSKYSIFLSELNNEQ